MKSAADFMLSNFDEIYTDVLFVIKVNLGMPTWIQGGVDEIHEYRVPVNDVQINTRSSSAEGPLPAASIAKSLAVSSSAILRASTAHRSLLAARTFRSWENGANEASGSASPRSISAKWKRPAAKVSQTALWMTILGVGARQFSRLGQASLWQFTHRPKINIL